MINQLFDINSIRQNITEVNKEVDKIKQNLQNLTAKIKIEVPSDIQTQINNLNTTFNSINSSLGEITTGQLRYAKALTESAKQAKLLAQEEAIRNKTAKQTIVTEQQVINVLNVEAKTMAEAAEQNRILRAAAKQLDLTNAENIKTLQIYNQQIEKNTEFIRKNSDAATQQKMNIGNYNSVWKGLNISVQQLVRELPSAKYGLDIFFLAISNNIPMLMDAIKGMQAFNKQMVETGQLDKKVSIGKELLKSLFSWQTAIMIGVTLLVQYGDEIIKWVGNLFKGEKALSASAKAQEALNNAWENGTKNAQNELIEFRLLTKAVMDNNLSMNDRKKVLGELRNQYPDYLSKLSDEEILAGKVGDAYNKIANGIMQTAIAKAKMDEMANLAEKLVEMQSKDDFLKQFTSTESLNQRIAVEEAEYKRLAEKYPITFSNGIAIEDILVKNARERLERLRSIKPILEAMELIAQSISSQEIANTIEPEKTKTTKVKKDKYPEILAELLGESYVQSLEEKRQRELAEVEKWYNEQIALIENRGGEFAEQEKQALERLNQARLVKIQKVNDDYNKEIAKEGRKMATAMNRMLQAGLKGMDNTYSAEESITKVEMLNEQAILTEKYNQNLINEEQYQRGMLEIKQRYAREALQTQIKYAEFEFDTLVEEREKLVKEYADLQAELNGGVDATRQREIEVRMSAISNMIGEGGDLSESNIGRIKAKIQELVAELNNLINLQHKENKDKGGMSLVGILGLDEKSLQIAEQVLQGVSDIMGEIDNLVNASFDARLQRIEEEAEAVEKSHDRQLESLQNLYEQGAISQEEYEARKRLQEEMTEKKKEELAKKEAELKNKQAKYDKASAIAQALINTALAITSAATVVPFIPLGSIAMGIASAMGALQVATIMATPLPKYAKGTNYHKGGLAVVGDGGKQEVVMTADGAYLTPDTPTLVNLPRGAKVFPDAGLLNPDDVHWARKPFIGGFSYDEKGEPIIINDYSSLEKEQRLTRLAIEKQRKEMRKYERNRQLSEYKRRAV